MGKITQYQVQKLASSAVGVPQQDNSGQIIASGVQKVVDTGVNLLAERKKQQDDLDGSLLSNKYVETVGTRSALLQRQYEKDPMKYPDALREELDKTATSMGQGLDAGVASQFQRQVSEVKARLLPRATQWALDQDKDITIQKVQKLYIDEAMRGEEVQSIEGMRALAKRFDIIDQKASVWMTPKSVSDLRNQYWPQARKAFAARQLMDNPVQFSSALERGRYDEIFSPIEVKQLKNEAFNAIAVAQKTATIRNLTSNIAEIQGIYDSVLKGTADLVDINRRLDVALTAKDQVDEKTGAKIVDPEYIEGLKKARAAFFAFQDQRRPGVRSAESKLATEDLWNGWKAVVTKDAENGVDPKDYQHALQQYNRLFTAWVNGQITDQDYNDAVISMEARLRTSSPGDKRKKYGIGLADVVNKAGDKHFWTSDDMYSYGYREIRKDIDGMNLMESQKNYLTLQYLARYTRMLDSTDPSMLPTDASQIKEKFEELWNGKGKLTGLRATMWNRGGFKVMNGRTYQTIVGPSGQSHVVVDSEFQKGLVIE